VQIEKTFVARICMWLGFITADAYAYLAAVVPVQKLWRDSRYSVGAVYKTEVRRDLISREVNGWKEQADLSKVRGVTARQSIRFISNVTNVMCAVVTG
jgi:hypothetical protein